MNQRALMASMLAVATFAAAAPACAVECFSIYDTRNTLVYQTANSPIDLSRSIEDQMARRFPSRYLVIADVSPCAPVGAAAVDPAVGPASLLSSRSTGSSSNDNIDYAADPYSPPPAPAAAATAPVQVRSTSRSGAARR